MIRRFLIALFILTAGSFSTSNASLRVGYDEKKLQLPEGISLAGYFQRRILKNSSAKYSRYFRSSTGTYNLPMVKAMAIDDGAKINFFVSLEIIAIEPDLKAQAEALLKTKIKRPFELNIFATHTHSGPGGFVKFGLWQQLATDIYLDEIFKSFVNSIADASVEAFNHLESAQVSYVKGELNNVTYNRRNSKFLDTHVHVLKFLSMGGTPLATILNFPIHGTGLGPDNLKISGDVPGVIEAELGRMTNAPVMFISGAAGDVGPMIEGDTFSSMPATTSTPTPIAASALVNYDKMQTLGDKVARQIFPIWQKTELIDPKPTITKKFTIELPHAQANLSLCIESLLPKHLQWIAKLFFNINLPGELNRPMEVSMVQFSPLTFYMIPGEPIGEIGEEIQKYSLANNLPNPIVMTLANSYYGYILSEKEFNRGGYETCNSFYGKKYGQKFLEGMHNSMDTFAKLVRPASLKDKE